MFDIIIKNGHVIDSYNGVDGVADVAISNGKIAGVGSYQNDEADRTIDASNHIVTPGLIDAHAHAFPLTGMGISVETACLSSGVTTLVDAGSAGWANYETNRGFIGTCKVRIKTFVNVSPVGIPANGYLENVDPDYLGGAHRKAIKRLFDTYRGELLGLKLRMNTGVIRDLGSAPLVGAIALAGKLGLPIVVHSADPAIPMKDILNMLRPGDVLTHMYHRRGASHLLDEHMRVIPEAQKARARGVLFDIGHAQGHCAIAVAQAAIEQGFLPDLIGTDACEEGVYREQLMFSMPFVLSKLMNLGISLADLIKMSTQNAAALIGMPGVVGCLGAGAEADVAIFELKDRPMTFKDRDGRVLRGTKLLKPVATIKGGQVVYRDIEFQ